ncbi:hypothetical protein B296_00056978, partial [Ensete ventricosum]
HHHHRNGGVQLVTSTSTSCRNLRARASLSGCVSSTQSAATQLGCGAHRVEDELRAVAITRIDSAP